MPICVTTLLAIFIYLPLFIFCAIFYINRTTKEFPKSFWEWKCELRTIFCGIRSQNEDFIFRRRNRIKLQNLPNRVAVITGGNRGIGLYVVEKLLKCDMKVILGVRNPESSKKAVEDALGIDLCKDNVTYFQCDTGNMESVQEFARKVKQSFPAIHLLINNAGIMNTPYQETNDGFENQMAVNYIGHFLLTHLLLPQLIEGSKSNEGKNVRIVNVSSCVHRITKLNFRDFHCKKYYYPADAYAKSKLAQVYFTKYLEVLFSERGLQIQAHAPHPGIVNTDLFVNSSMHKYAPWFGKIFYKTPRAGARTIVYAAISPYLEGKGGTYLSNCYFDKSHPRSKDLTEIKRLFDYTCQLLKIKSFGEV